ncbi:MAG: hypothetical protein H8M99_14350 [Gloeobacteraceae cyanobacterium ES-bin-144]|nr:hypothetical protein [Verrucomicrobiales bacterium]
MSEAKEIPQASARSPFAGCAILIAALLVMVFLIGFSTYALFRQYNEIAKFTSDKAAPLQISSIENSEATLNALASRFELFRQQLSGDAEASLTLTPEEINLAIAAYEPFKDLRGTFRVLDGHGETLRIAISFQLNGKPRLARKDETGWLTSDPRFLNAVLVARPALFKNEVVLKLDTIEVSDAKVPIEFIEQMSPYRITERYLATPEIGPVMARLTRVETSGGRVVLKRVPGEQPADKIGNEQVDAASSRFFMILGIMACVFLTFAGVVVFLGLRAKARRA